MEADKTDKTFIPYLTFLQVISAFSVVYLHTNSCFWEFSSVERYWKTANIIECAFYFAVPVFFMISGVTLLDYQERYSLHEYFHKRFVKTVIPYVAWSGIAIIAKWIMREISEEDLNIRYVVNGLLNGNGIISIFWFFPALFSLYLSMPLLSSVRKNKRKEIFTYLLVVGFLVNVLVPFVKSVLDLDFIWPLAVGVVTGYLIWPVAGYLLHYYPPKLYIRLILYITSIAGLLMHIIGTAKLSLTSGHIVELYKGYNNVPCVLYSVGIFVFFEQLGKRIMQSSFLSKVILMVGKYTFSIYLMHWFVMEFLIYLTDIDTRSIIWRLGAPLIIVPLVLGITFIIRKIPLLRRIVP